MEVFLNCAVDRKGRMAGPGGEAVRISDDVDLRRVHAMRADCDAILVGVGTVLQDDPSLRVKPQYAKGGDPVRVILDTDLRTPPVARVLDGSAPTRIYTTKRGRFEEAQTVRVPAGAGGVDLAAVLVDLEKHGLRQVMVEGGPTVLRAFVDADLWHRWTIFEAAMDLGHGPGLWGGLPYTTQAGMHLVSKEPVGAGTLWTFSRG